ncbi:MAG: beta-galactosidase [Nocardioidaceae bacterium]
MIAFGGDYYPEQWPRDTWLEDVRLMAEAGVTMVTVGVFSWGLLEPAPDTFEFGWLDEVLDLLAQHEIAVDLATGTASPPAWLTYQHPEILPVDRDGRRLWAGSRQAWCPSSPVYRERAALLVRQLATRYAGHPALAMWHAGNEYGCHNAHCYCDTTAADFRRWLRATYDSIDAVNEAWSTRFWSQHLTDFEQVLPPRVTPTFNNPSQVLDFKRFSSDALLSCFVAERDLLHALAPGVPVTTNFLVMLGFDRLDYWRWAREVDIVSNDHYIDAADPEAHIELARSADLTRGLAGNKPWILMEHSTGAVNWQPRNRAKRPGEMLRNSVQHVARGADGVLFFQWRASRGGAEKFHSAMLPHGGTNSRIWSNTVELGRHVARLASVAGSTPRSQVAIMFDFESSWLLANEALPSTDVEHSRIVQDVYAGLWHGGVTVDFVPPGADLTGYALAILPCQHALSPAEVAPLQEYVESGGVALVTYFSGIVDRSDQVVLGGYPALLRSLLGLVVEEFDPLLEGAGVELDDGSTADTWSEHIITEGADVVRRFSSGPLAGEPAITRNRVGSGEAWYVGTHLTGEGWRHLAAAMCTASGLHWAPVEGVERVTRYQGRDAFTFVINHHDSPRPIGAAGHDLLTDAAVDIDDVIPAGAVAVVHSADARARGDD